MHLTNMWGDFQLEPLKVGENRWLSIKKSCEKTGKLCPDAFSTGLYVGISPDFSTHSFFEINTFGDLL